MTVVTEPESTILGAAQVRLLSMYPLSILYGGFEHQCVQTCAALQAIGVNAELLDWHNPKDKCDLLHLFGPSPGWWEVAYQASKTCRLVVSAIAGAKGAHRLLNLANRFVAFAGSGVRQQTSYMRTRALLHAAQRVICLNELEYSFFSRLYDVPPQRLVIIPNGVPEARFQATGELFQSRYGIEDYVLFVGNIVERKNPLRLAQALAKHNLPGVFIGGTVPSEAAYARRFAAFIQGVKHLLWIPGLEYDDPLLSSAYAGARLFCLPSVLETQPLSALEAMAAGVPVLLGDRPYAYQPPFEHVLRCEPTQMESLTNAVDAALRGGMDRAIRLPSSFTWRGVAQRLAAVYYEVMHEELPVDA